MQGLGLSIILTIASVALGMIFGAVLAFFKLSKSRILKVIANIYITIIRCTPPIIVLFLVFYGLPLLVQAVFGLDINKMERAIYVVIAMTLMSAASFAETFRAAYEGVPKGQYEAALCFGLSKWQAFRRIILPQLIVIALPNIGNSVIGIFKEGALAFTIGVFDLMGRANFIVTKNMGAYARELYIGVALIYWIIVIVMERGQRILSKRLGRFRESTAEKASVSRKKIKHV